MRALLPASSHSVALSQSGLPELAANQFEVPLHISTLREGVVLSVAEGRLHIPASSVASHGDLAWTTLWWRAHLAETLASAREAELPLDATVPRCSGELALALAAVRDPHFPEGAAWIEDLHRSWATSTEASPMVALAEMALPLLERRRLSAELVVVVVPSEVEADASVRATVAALLAGLEPPRQVVAELWADPGVGPRRLVRTATLAAHEGSLELAYANLGRLARRVPQICQLLRRAVPEPPGAALLAEVERVRQRLDAQRIRLPSAPEGLLRRGLDALRRPARRRR